MLRAAELSGGVDQLAARLTITPALLKGMMKRHLPVPERVFLRVVDTFFNRDAADNAKPAANLLSRQPLSQRALARALELSDGSEHLAAELLLSVSDLQSMLDGVSPVPEEIFFQAVDLLIDRGLTGRRIAIVRPQSSGQQQETASEPSDFVREFKPEAKALANALANLPAGRRIPQSSFKWLPMDAFGRLTQEQKETYLTEIIKQLGLHP